MWRRRDLAAAAGIVGPVVFTTSWLASGRRQASYSIFDEHISGLAAADARDPHLLTVGFMTLGACTVLFARELRRQLRESGSAGPGPTVLELGGWFTVVAACFRRDYMLLAPPGLPDDWQQSWVNDVHDVASLVVYICSVVAPLLLALRFRGDADWERLRGVAYASSGVSLVLMAWFSTETARPGNGVVQRVMVSVPLLFMVLTAAHMLQRSRHRRSIAAGRRSGHPVRLTTRAEQTGRMLRDSPLIRRAYVAIPILCGSQLRTLVPESD